MSANFNFYLNRQGAKGRKGDKGEQGYSPSISVETETAAEYVLKIQNEGYSFTTPNLRGNAIENTGGTYIRYNTATGQMYTGGLDLATTQSAGAVMLTPTGGIAIGGSTNDVPTSAEVYDYVESKISSIGEGYVTETEFDNYTAATALTLNGIAGDISTLDTSKMSFTDLVSSLVAGSNITLTTDAENKTITINAAGGDLTNYVTTNTAQTITGSKTFTTNLNLQETSPCINFKAGAGQTMGYVRFDSTGQTMRVHSNGIMYIETNQHSGTNAINVDNLVVQSDIAAKENTSNKVTSISSASTNTEYPSAKCVYDAIQSELGNITTLLNNINSGSGS